MPKTRPVDYKMDSAIALKGWFEKKPDSFCYVSGKVRQIWFIGHNSLVIDGKNVQLNFLDITGGVWLVTVKESKSNEQKEQKEKGAEGN